MNVNPRVKDGQAWHAMSVSDVLTQLKTSVNGLTNIAANDGLITYGPNKVLYSPRLTALFPWQKKFTTATIILMITALLFKAVCGDIIEAIGLFAMVILNIVIYTLVEHHGQEELKKIQKPVIPEIETMRNGQRQLVRVSELIPGDIVYLQRGDIVPADMRLFETEDLYIHETTLTGTQLPVQKEANVILETNTPVKDRTNMAFMGTSISYGNGKGVIVNTGSLTELGSIAKMLDHEGLTPLEVKLDRIDRAFKIGTLVLAAILFASLVIRDSATKTAISMPTAYINGYIKNIAEIYLVSILLLYIAIQQTTVSTIALNFIPGLQRMLHRLIFVRSPASLEKLPSINTICVDETNILSQNPTVSRLWIDGQHFTVTDQQTGEFLKEGLPIDIKDYPALITVAWLGMLNNDSEIEDINKQQEYKTTNDLTESALLMAGAKMGAVPTEISRAYPRVKQKYIKSNSNLTITVHDVAARDVNDLSPFYNEKNKDWVVTTLKGAPEQVWEMCSQYQTMDDTPKDLKKNDKITTKPDDLNYFKDSSSSERAVDITLQLTNYQSMRELDPMPAIREQKQNILGVADAMSRDGLHVLGLAYRVEEGAPDLSEEIDPNFVFVGLIGLIETPRPKVRETIEKNRRAGIRTVIITSESPNLIGSLSDAIDLQKAGQNIVTGRELEEMSDVDLLGVLEKTEIFAGTTPDQKTRIIKTLQSNKHAVISMYDDTSEILMINNADVSVTTGTSGISATETTADIVLPDNNYVHIVSLVEEGRIAYKNISKFTFFLLSSKVAKIIMIFLAALAGLPLPLTIAQLLWVNLITDSSLATILTLERDDPEIMNQKQHPREHKLFNTMAVVRFAIQVISQTGVILLAYGIGIYGQVIHNMPIHLNSLSSILQYDWHTVDIGMAQTMAFITLLLSELIRVYSIRSAGPSLLKLGIFSIVYMRYAVVICFLLLIMIAIPVLKSLFNIHPLGIVEWLIVVGLAIIPGIVEEIFKLFISINQKIFS